VMTTLQGALGEPRGATIVWRAQNDIAVEGEAAEKVLKLIDALDDVDDVQNVYANFDISEDLLEQLSSE
jgi:transcriptional/translational regulatory protein YebC/TACO1